MEQVYKILAYIALIISGYFINYYLNKGDEELIKQTRLEIERINSELDSIRTVANEAIEYANQMSNKADSTRKSAIEEIEAIKEESQRKEHERNKRIPKIGESAALDSIKSIISRRKDLNQYFAN